MTPAVVVDDHLLRDVLAARTPRALETLAEGRPMATTNLYYARLCKSAASAKSVGRLLGDWPEEERRALMATLVALPDDVVVLPMRDLAWEMGEVVTAFGGVSALGAEAVVAAKHLGATLCVSADDDGPGIRAAAKGLRVPYRAIKSPRR